MISVEIIDYQDNWQKVKDRAMNTIGKDTGKYPSSKWKSNILLAEHSPIRELKFTIRFYDIPYYIVMHLVRHKIGVEHYVSTQRTDRTGVDRNKLPQDNLVTYTMVADAQALINISRKRLCSQASKETREVWNMVRNAIADVGETELAYAMQPECVYRGFCPELNSCGYSKTEAFSSNTRLYRDGQN